MIINEFTDPVTCTGRRRRTVGLRGSGLLRVDRPRVVGLRLRAAGRARRLRQDLLLHRMDQPDHQREQPVAVCQSIGKSDQKVTCTRELFVGKQTLETVIEVTKGRGGGVLVPHVCMDGHE